MHPFTQRRAESVAAWGEEKLIAAIRRWLGNTSPPSPFGIGDDCAVLQPSSKAQLITVDPVVYARHFDDTIAPHAVGAKLLKRNLSDIAAMGGRPVAAVVSLTLDARTRRRWLEAFYRGLAGTARAYDVAIVGGDIAQANGTLAASLTLLGVATGSRVLTRTGARIGDHLYVTGQLGRSLPTGHHFRFVPRLAEGQWLARQREVRAMMDVSDGLAKDVHALTPRGAAAAIDKNMVPRRRGADIRAAASDGEDYELLFALDRDANRVAFERRWARAFPRVPLTRIGALVRHDAVPASALNLSRLHGYEHLR